MKPDTWMPLYIGDYTADTVDLTRAEHGAYLLCLMAYWRKGGPLADKEARAIAGREWKRVKRFFADDGGHWRHKRVDAELLKAGRVYETRCRWARAGGEANKRAWRSRTDSRKDSHTDILKDSGTLAQPQPQPQLQENNNVSRAEPPTAAAHAIPPLLRGLPLYEADPKLCFAIPQLEGTWRQAYPGVDLRAEIAAAHAWEMANPARRKKLRTAFLNRWLAKAQDRPRQSPRPSEGTFADALKAYKPGDADGR
jgi:uncharacterized protein YdaU (DUF1376 family)